MLQTKQAVSQQEIKLASGEVIANLTPDLNDGRVKAIVDLEVIKRLAMLLPKASVTTLMLEHAKNVEVAALANGVKIEDFTTILQDELAFHTSVNLITEYEPEPKAETEPQYVMGAH